MNVEKTINSKQIENLIKKLPLLEALLKNLQLEVRRIYNLGREKFINDDEILYALSIGNRIMTDMPHVTPLPDDKNVRIITNYKDIIGKAYAETLRELIESIFIVGDVVEKMQNALDALTENQRYILREFYKEGTERKTWKEIASELGVYRETAKEEKTRSIEKMSRILRINTASYEFCMKELDVLQVEEKSSQ